MTDELEAIFEQSFDGISPICAHCGRIRDEEGQWHEMLSYLTRHYRHRFSHGICPNCKRKHYPGYLD